MIDFYFRKQYNLDDDKTKRGSVMDIHNVRQQLKTRTIYDLSLRVTYYARVSSEKDEQLNSLGNQISYYEDFIKKNPPNRWTLYFNFNLSYILQYKEIKYKKDKTHQF